MKTILVPIDFSNCAKIAARFAIEIAKATKAKVVLMHSFHVPIPPPDAVVDPISVDTLRDENMKALEKLANEELQQTEEEKAIEIVCEVTIGFAVDEISAAAEKHNIGLIVMGTQGASGVKKYVFGSNTANVVHKCRKPVLVVPENASFKGFRRIALAVDLHEIKDNSIFTPLQELALMFNSEIKLFSVRKEKDGLISMEQAFEKLNLDQILDNIPHSFHLAEDENIVKAIDSFVADSKADLLATIPQKHNFFDILFNKSVTRDLAFHTQTPLLSLPDIH